MSRGPGSVETRIGDLFAANQDRALSIDEIARHAFSLGDQPPSRAQRLSATRAAHRVVRRTREMDEGRGPLMREAVQRVRAALGRETDTTPAERDEYWALLRADPAWGKADRMRKAAYRIGFRSRLRRGGDRISEIDTEYWRATTLGRGRGAKLWFHAPDVPMQVWAVKIDRGGVHWFDTEIVRVTRRNVVVHYAGAIARLDRDKLWRWWAWWRGVMFVSSRTGVTLPSSRSYGGSATALPAACRRPCRCRSPTRSRCWACRRTTPART